MGDFLKVFVRGIVCTVLLPLILLVLVFYTIYCLLVYVFMLIRNILVFFTGGSVYTMKEDLQAKKVLNDKEKVSTNVNDVIAGLMHSAIEQNPEAVRAMAQQQIATQQLKQALETNPTDDAITQEIPQHIVEPEEGKE